MSLNKQTFKFKLVSGVEAEVTELTGKHQRILTQRLKGQTHSDRLNLLLADVLVRVGSFKAIDLDFVENMLSEDRRLALLMARQFTMDFEDKFKFTYEYEGMDGSTQTHDLEIPLKDDGTFPIHPMKIQFDEYADIERERFVTLPKSGIKVKYVLLDGKGERIGIQAKKDERSSHTILEMRRPQYEKEEGVWLKLPLDDLGLKDIEALREDMKSAEGRVDTEIKFEHPDAENREPSEKWVVVDVLGTVNFFFPSGTI